LLCFDAIFLTVFSLVSFSFLIFDDDLCDFLLFFYYFLFFLSWKSFFIVFKMFGNTPNCRSIYYFMNFIIFYSCDKSENLYILFDFSFPNNLFWLIFLLKKICFFFLKKLFFILPLFEFQNFLEWDELKMLWCWSEIFMKIFLFL